MLLKKPAEQEALELCEAMLSEAKGYRDRFKAEYEEYERFYAGTQWRGLEDRPINNLIFSNIETQLPVITDARPGTSVLAIEDENLDRATVLKEAIDYIYQQNYLDLRLSQSIRTSLKVGTGFMYVGYDADLNHGKGDITVKSLPWRWVFLDPGAGEIDDMNYVIIRIPMKLENIKRMFPKDADDIAPEDVELEDIESDNTYRDPSRDTYMIKSSNSLFKIKDMAYYHEFWKKDYTMEKIKDEETLEVASNELDQVLSGMAPDVQKWQDHESLIAIHSQNKMNFLAGAIQDPNPETAMLLSQAIQEDPNFNVIVQLFDDLIASHEAMMMEHPDGTKPKYKSFMRVIVKVGENILFDGSPDVEDGMFPICPIYAYKEEEKPYAFGEIKNIISAQKIYNDLHYAEYKSLLMNSNPGWMIDDNSDVDKATLTNEQGIVVTKRAGTEVRRLESGVTNPQLGQKQQELKNDIDNISGINMAIQGQNPTGVTAARAIEALQQQSIGRIRQKSRNLEYTMIRMGKLVLSRIFTYWTSKRVLQVYDDNGRLQGMEFNPEDYDKSKYEVRVSPGTTFGLSKEVVLEQTTNLVDRGIIDAKTYIKLNDFPFKNTILSDIEARDALAAENEQLKTMLAQLTGGGGQPTPAEQGQPQQGLPPAA